MPTQEMTIKDDIFENEAKSLRLKKVFFDVTDKTLYSFNEQDSMTKIREASTAMAFNMFFSLVDSETIDFVGYATEKIPHLKKVFESLKGNTELIVKLSDNARKKLESGEWHWALFGDGSGMCPTLKDVSEHWAESIRVVEKTVNPELLNSLIGLTQKNDIDALTEKIIYLTDVVERIADGQYNDRIAMFYGARQIFIEAMGMDSMENRRIALLNAAKSAADAISALQQTIQYDLNSLSTVKSGKQLDKITKMIAKSLSKLNDSIQISINVYDALGERRALLASVTSYQCFVEQTLLSVYNISDEKYSGCTMAELMYAYSKRDEVDWRQLPKDIVCACETIIQTESKMIEYLSKYY